MARTTCLSYASPARALHRVLVSNLPSRNTALPSSSINYLFPPRLFSTSSTRILTKPSRPSLASPPLQNGNIRTLTTTPPLNRIVDAFKNRLTNAKIPYQWVRIAAPAPESTLSPPRRKESVLSTLDPKKYTLVMVAPPPPRPEPENTDPSSTPVIAEPLAAICRIVDNAAASAVASEAARAERRKNVDSKELELSWSITKHDLGHKLRRLRDFLERGMSVEVILAKKRRGRAATREEAGAVLEAVREAVGEVVGAKEGRKMDGGVGGTARLFLEGAPEGKRLKGGRKKKENQDEGEVEKVGDTA